MHLNLRMCVSVSSTALSLSAYGDIETGNLKVLGTRKPFLKIQNSGMCIIFVGYHHVD
jgi:hypothetical protein